MKTFISLILALMISTLGAPVWAANNITLEALAEVEVEITKDDGTKGVERVPATKVIPGTEVIYTISYTNAGNKSAEKVVITDPIPEHMLYILGSARGTNTTITYSVDGGKTFASANELKVKNTDGSERPAQSDDYTHIRWNLNQALKPESSGEVEFRARLK